MTKSGKTCTTNTNIKVSTSTTTWHRQTDTKWYIYLFLLCAFYAKWFNKMKNFKSFKNQHYQHWLCVNRFCFCFFRFIRVPFLIKNLINCFICLKSILWTIPSNFLASQKQNICRMGKKKAKIKRFWSGDLNTSGIMVVSYQFT